MALSVTYLASGGCCCADCLERGICRQELDMLWALDAERRLAAEAGRRATHVDDDRITTGLEADLAA